MKIAFVSRILYPYNVGGSGRYVTFLANHMQKLGANVEAICPPLPENESEFELKFKVTCLHWPAIKPFALAYYFFIKNAADYISKNNFDLAYWTGWAVARVNIPSIANPFGLEFFKNGLSANSIFDFFMNLRMKRQYAAVDRVISEGGRITGEIEKFLGVKKEKIVEIPDGVDLDYIAGMKNSPASTDGEPEKKARNTFLYAGRLEKNKGVDYLLEAFDSVSSKYDVELWVIGDGTIKSRLQKNCLNPKVKFFGKVSDEFLFKAYSKADLFVFPTLYEGLPIVVLEAMACGLPVLSTDVGGVPGAVSAQNGFLLPPRDSKAIAEAMEIFLNMPEPQRRILGRKSEEIVNQNFTWPELAKKTIRVCGEVLSEKNKARG